MLSFEIGQRESYFYNERTDRITEPSSIVLVYRYIYCIYIYIQGGCVYIQFTHISLVLHIGNSLNNAVYTVNEQYIYTYIYEPFLLIFPKVLASRCILSFLSAALDGVEFLPSKSRHIFVRSYDYLVFLESFHYIGYNYMNYLHLSFFFKFNVGVSKVRSKNFSFSHFFLTIFFHLNFFLFHNFFVPKNLSHRRTDIKYSPKPICRICRMNDRQDHPHPTNLVPHFHHYLSAQS